MPASNIDFSVITQVIHFSVLPDADGSLETNLNVLAPGYTDVVARAHAAGRQTLICVGGGGSNFPGPVSNSLSSLVTHLAAYFSITNSKAASDLFISFEDPRACAAKASYARNRGL